MSALSQMTCTEDVDAGVLDLQVVQLRRESREVLSVLLADPHGCVLPEWEPGAHVDLVLGDVLPQYSLCGDPGDRLMACVSRAAGPRLVLDL
jgi:ferredoxin-NADP reductase